MWVAAGGWELGRAGELIAIGRFGKLTNVGGQVGVLRGCLTGRKRIRAVSSEVLPVYALVWS